MRLSLRDGGAFAALGAISNRSFGSCAYEVETSNLASRCWSPADRLERAAQVLSCLNATRPTSAVATIGLDWMKVSSTSSASATRGKCRSYVDMPRDRCASREIDCQSSPIILGLAGVWVVTGGGATPVAAIRLCGEILNLVDQQMGERRCAASARVSPPAIRGSAGLPERASASSALPANSAWNSPRRKAWFDEDLSRGNPHPAVVACPGVRRSPSSREPGLGIKLHSEQRLNFAGPASKRSGAWLPPRSLRPAGGGSPSFQGLLNAGLPRDSLVGLFQQGVGWADAGVRRQAGPLGGGVAAWLSCLNLRGSLEDLGARANRASNGKCMHCRAWAARRTVLAVRAKVRRRTPGNRARGGVG